MQGLKQAKHLRIQCMNCLALEATLSLLSLIAIAQMLFVLAVSLTTRPAALVSATETQRKM